MFPALCAGRLGYGLSGMTREGTCFQAIPDVSAAAPRTAPPSTEVPQTRWLCFLLPQRNALDLGRVVSAREQLIFIPGAQQSAHWRLSVFLVPGLWGLSWPPLGVNSSVTVTGDRGRFPPRNAAVTRAPGRGLRGVFGLAFFSQVNSGGGRQRPASGCDGTAGSLNNDAPWIPAQPREDCWCSRHKETRNV